MPHGQIERFGHSTAFRRGGRARRGKSPPLNRSLGLEHLERRTLLAIELISAALPSLTGDLDSGNRVVLSGDGRYVAFESDATNLVVGDTNGFTDIFVRDTSSSRTTRVNTDSNGVQASFVSSEPSISSDGRYVAFASYAANLVPADGNSTQDVFVKDTVTGITVRVSTDSNGAQGNGISYNSSISSDGRYVAFWSGASNLVADDTNFTNDVFVKDMVTGRTARVSTDSGGAQANGESSFAAISANGRYVAFRSNASNLVVGDTNGVWDIFVKDTLMGTIRRVSTSSSGAQADRDSHDPSISSDGRYVTYQSDASNLVPGDTNFRWDIFMRDTVTGTTTRLSTDSNGVQATGFSYSPSISGDGRYVAFRSEASNLVAGDAYFNFDIFVKDTSTGMTTRVSADSSGLQGNGNSSEPAISGDGQYVAFSSDATNLLAGDENGVRDIFIKHALVGALTAASIAVPNLGASGNSWSYVPSISGDGRYLAFSSDSTNLVAGDTNRRRDIFVKDTAAGTMMRVNTAADGAQANDESDFPSISRDGRFVAFRSDAWNLTPGGSVFRSAIYLKDTLTGTVAMVSTDSNGVQAEGESGSPSISADGRYVAFWSRASNLAPGGTFFRSAIFVKDTLLGTTTRVSTDNHGVEADGDSNEPSISGDGRYVTFLSAASNLVAGDNVATSNIFVKDLLTGTITRVSSDPSGDEANNHSGRPSISSNGRYIAFASLATNLVPADTNNSSDIFLKDTVTGETTRVSTDSNGAQFNGESIGPSISADGRYVAFMIGGRNGISDVILKDTVAGTFSLISTNSSGLRGDGPSHSPSISADGASVAFASMASNFAANDRRSNPDIFRALIGARVAGRQVFYNNSDFDGNDSAAGTSDDGAIGPDKAALLPGETASVANYTSYSRGLNGIMVDIAGGHGTITVADFAFKVGNNNSPGSWAAGPVPASLTLRPGAGIGGSDRYTLIWADGAIQKTWLQATVLANANTGLASEDVFYFGNAIGEVGNSTASAMVTSADEALIRVNRIAGAGNLPVTSPYDIDRDGSVTSTDAALARVNQTTAFSALRLIAVPASSPLAPREVSGVPVGQALFPAESLGVIGSSGNRPGDPLAEREGYLATVGLSSSSYAAAEAHEAYPQASRRRRW
jgi:Tol biopolymer transport system component